jgi:nitric oxide dioxygenase
MHDTVKTEDIIQVSAPRGDFWVDIKTKNPDAPLVLVSGGVGLTCMNSIRKAVMEADPARPITWVHGARHTAVRAFSKTILDDAKTNDNLQVVLFNSSVTPEDERGVHYHHQGYVDLDKMDKDAHLFLGNPKAEYYICGPMPFMLSLDKAFQSKGVTPAQIHMELFGTGGVQK